MPDGGGDLNNGMSGEGYWRRRYALSTGDEVKEGRDATGAEGKPGGLD